MARPQGPGRKTPCPVAQKAGGSWHEDKTQGRVGQETRGHGHVRQEFNRAGDVVHEARHKAPTFCDTRGRRGRRHGTSHRRQDPRLHERAVGRPETGPRTVGRGETSRGEADGMREAITHDGKTGQDGKQAKRPKAPRDRRQERRSGQAADGWQGGKGTWERKFRYMRQDRRRWARGKRQGPRFAKIQGAAGGNS